MIKKEVIGTTMNKKSVYINILILTAHTLIWTFLGIYLCIGNTLELNQSFRIVFMLLVTFALLIIQLPLIGATQRIEFSDESIDYYYVKGYFSQFNEVIRILKEENEQPSIHITINDIDKINLSYRKTHGGYGLTGYMLVLSFYMKNKTMITLSPENMVQSKAGVYLELMNLLLDKEIMIYDKFDLQEGLISDSRYFQNYVEKIERKNNL